MKIEFTPKSGQPMAKFKILADGFKRAVMKATGDGAALVLAEAIKRCPKDTGTLHRSGKCVPTGPALSKIIRFDTPYAAKIHEGFNRKDGKPYRLGPRSVMQAAEYGVTVGPKFIPRAESENKEKIKAVARAALDVARMAGK